MKIIKLSYFSKFKEPSVEIISDSAIQKTGKPFFIPDFAKKLSCRVALMAHVCRLGKNIASKFAHRYYDEIGLALLIEADDLLRELSEKGWPLSLATSFDSSVVTGHMYPKEICNDAVVDLRINDKSIHNNEMQSVPRIFDSSIEYISRYFTLKIGDFIVYDFNIDKYEPVIGDVLSATINGKESIDIKFK